MSATVYRINALLSTLLHSLPVGTNLALFHLLWTLLSGRCITGDGRTWSVGRTYDGWYRCNLRSKLQSDDRPTPPPPLWPD